MIVVSNALRHRRRVWSVYFATVFLVLTQLAGCKRPARVVVHPIDSLRVVPVHARTIDLALHDTTSATVRLARAALLSAAPTPAIGTMVGSEDTMFGSIADVATDDDGTLYVLDPRFNEVRVFARDGTFRYAFGVLPDGKRKLRNPRAIAIDSAHRIYVADLPDRVHVFVPENGRHVFSTTLGLGIEPFDICVMHGSLYVNGMAFHGELNLHRFDLQGKLIRSFGAVYHSGQPLIDFEMSRGHVACAPEENKVYFAPGSVLPEVIGYGGDGSPLWFTQFAGFRPMLVMQLPKGSSQTKIPPDGFNRIDGLSYLASTHQVLVQIAHVRRANAHGGGQPRANLVVDSLQTLALSAQTGEGGFLSARVPPFRHIDHASFVSVFDQPYPYVERHLFRDVVWHQ